MLTLRLDELTKHVGDIDKKLDKNQIHQQIAQLAIEKQFFKGMKRFGGNIIYKQNGDLYCDLHGNRLLKIENRSHAYCNACGFNFHAIASMKGRTLGTLPSWKCRPCDFDICEYCMQNSDYFK
ncbi:hypothetical protein FGO68_gene3997 [Halteria grandinella]|uniref:Uncharacterized protein n=1 Tax=Halteria grandinella TaxID=5974 RepID=A0A8J8NLG7_HALGN|nr:hypothetical protein FGO68_gene3997 [Halteria grandinella]